MKRYMRDQFDYLGIKVPEMGTCSSRNITARMVSRLSPTSMRSCATSGPCLSANINMPPMACWKSSRRSSPPISSKPFEYLLVTKSWWDTVDTIATGAVGVHFKRYPIVRRKYLPRWRKSDNFWLRRSAILFQLSYKSDTDFALLCDIICENLDSKEFFINKAIGWALRQYARIDPQAVRDFVAARRCIPSAPARPSSG